MNQEEERDNQMDVSIIKVSEHEHAFNFPLYRFHAIDEEKEQTLDIGFYQDRCIIEMHKSGEKGNRFELDHDAAVSLIGYMRDKEAQRLLHVLCGCSSQTD